jgi:hypothetical protein
MRQNIIMLALRAAQFAQRPHAVRSTAASTMLLLVLGLTLSDASEPKQGTLQAWEAYVQTVNMAIEERAAGRSPFLWVDQSPDLIRRVRGGEMLVESHDPHKAPKGLIHDVVGAMFIPNVTLDQVSWVLNDFDRYQDFYRPLVVKSKLLERTDDHEKVTLLMMQKVFGVTAAVETDDEIQIMKLDANRVYSLSNAVRVQEIADYGQPSEHPFAEDRRPGYVWRTLSVTLLEQRDGGVYVEMETIALSRGIPWEFRWLIKPLTEHLPRRIMFEMLKDTRDAVRGEIEPTSPQDRKFVKSRTRE